MKRVHIHEAVRSTAQRFTSPVSNEENPAAHGGLTVTETCECGATRATNKNGPHQEVGDWCEHEPMTRVHEHEAVRSGNRPFNGSVSRDNANPAAHGGYCEVETCECGAIRATNINGRHREVGPWCEVEPDAELEAIYEQLVERGVTPEDAARELRRVSAARAAAVVRIRAMLEGGDDGV